MTNEDLCSLPVKDRLSARSVVFMWATCPKLNSALEVLAGWGLHYRGVAFVWIKTNAAGIPYGAWGVRPSIVKPTTELVLAASTVQFGRPLPLFSEKICQTVFALRGEHSRKPLEVQERIELMYPNATKLEMFSRPPLREGWDHWGNEVP
jgi:N6-adenosine-specific RNA methylase IME4